MDKNHQNINIIINIICIAFVLLLTGCNGNSPREGSPAPDSSESMNNTPCSNGITITSINNSESSARAIALQTDGKAIAAGSVLNGSNYDIALVRYNTDGSLDETFGTEGTAIIGIVTTQTALSMHLLVPEG